MSDLEGSVVAYTSGGSLHFGQIAGPVTAHASGGSIHLDGGNGMLAVDTSGGTLVSGKWPVQSRHIHLAAAFPWMKSWGQFKPQPLAARFQQTSQNSPKPIVDWTLRVVLSLPFVRRGSG